ncbi:hypothetical protein GCM10017706_00030 [Lactococcus lactis subsp. hordniae]
MEKIKILKAFTDIRTKQLYRVGQEVEVAEERVKEIEDNLEALVEVILKFLMIPSLRRMKRNQRKQLRKKGSPMTILLF